jgi:integrase
MALEMKAGSRWWYLRYRDGKRVRQVRLNVGVRGRVPAGPDDDGDRVFRASKAEAETEHDRVLAEIRGDPGAEKAIQRIVQIKTGAKIDFPLLADLGEHWTKIPRRRDPNERYAQQCKSELSAFAAFVHKMKPEVVQFVQVSPAIAQAYLEHRHAQGVSTKTWNDTLKLLRATFKHLHPQLAEGQNPFHRMVTRTLETVNRHPFSPEEMKKILDACADDAFIRPIIVAGMCTAMRRGDCCQLRWEDVDLKAGFITVKTSKTGETVDIPILALFRDELLKAESAREEGAEYVFPEQARMYEMNSGGITLRVQRALSAALGGPVMTEVFLLPAVAPEEALRLGRDYIAKMPNRVKAQRMATVFEAYVGGKSIREVTKESGLSKGTVSGHLAEIELGAGCKLVRGRRQEGASFAARMKADTSVLHAKRSKGSRRASVRDFHSFRVTWITIALAAGVPLEIVQRVTGHKTVDVVLKHYFRPGREDFRRTLENAMPRLFLEPAQPKALPATAVAGGKDAGGEYKTDETPSSMIHAAIECLEKMTAQNWLITRDEALRSLRGASQWVDSRILHEPSSSLAS